MMYISRVINGRGRKRKKEKKQMKNEKEKYGVQKVRNMNKRRNWKRQKKNVNEE